MTIFKKTTDLAYGAAREKARELDETECEIMLIELLMVMAKLKCTCEEALNKLGFKGR